MSETKKLRLSLILLDSFRIRACNSSWSKIRKKCADHGTLNWLTGNQNGDRRSNQRDRYVCTLVKKSFRTNKWKTTEDEMKRTQKNKATEGHLGSLKAKLAKLRTELLEGEKSSGGGGEGTHLSCYSIGKVLEDLCRFWCGEKWRWSRGINWLSKCRQIYFIEVFWSMILHTLCYWYYKTEANSQKQNLRQALSNLQRSLVSRAT